MKELRNILGILCLAGCVLAFVLAGLSIPGCSPFGTSSSWLPVVIYGAAGFFLWWLGLRLRRK